MKRVISGRPPMIPEIMSLKKRKDPSLQNFAEMDKIISALANVDSIKIFHKAKEGIESSTQAIKCLDLTPYAPLIAQD